MPAVSFTPEQKAVIENRGGALLVSAAAGSGKTRVLVERLLARVLDPDRPVDIDRFLIITYTNAAAEELRSRIQDALSERAAREPENRRLRRQAALVYSAQIGTIHGFCARLIRENAHLLGIGPDSRVADEKECAVLKLEALDALLEERYKTIGQSEGFRLLVDTMGAGRDDRRLIEIVLDAHTRLMSHPDPARWAQEQIRQLDALTKDTDAASTPWGMAIMDQARRAALYWKGVVDALLGEAQAHPDFWKAYGESLECTRRGLENFLAALDRGWDEARRLAEIPFPRAKNVKGYEDLKQIRKRCKEAMEKVADAFECSSGELMEDMMAVRPAVEELLRLVLDFDRAYGALKRRRGLIDFADQEHMAARLLIDLETGQPTELARAVAGRFEEVMVDEYQDVNPVQELIFTAVTQGGRNLFMVGDVRQSIYRFRLADPTIFLRKYNTYKDAGETVEGEPRKILLAKNFRSRPGILEAVNFVFHRVMTEEFAEMDYTEREFLRPGREETRPDDPAVELYVIDMGASAAPARGSGEEEAREDEAPEKKEEGEAAFIAAKIEEMVREGYQVPDENGGMRPCRYGDFAILLRSVKSAAPVYASALSSRGVPCAYGGDETPFTERAEVAIVLALLDVIDNPNQDIPLITVLKSPLFGFTPDELASIRLADPQGSFYSALTRTAERSEKCASFLRQLSEWRDLAGELPVDRLLWHIYSVTGLLGLMGALPGGGERRESLMRLLQYAAQFESNGWRGLFDFALFLRRLREQGEEPVEPESGLGGDAVKILSVHKSKGLEYPVVFLAGTTKRFNLTDASKTLLIHASLGAGPKRVDLDRRIAYPTLARMAVSQVLRREMVAEELRVLYVAMTRAREKLIVTAAYNDAEKELHKLREEARPLLGSLDKPFETEALQRVRDQAGFILLPALRRPESAALFGEAAPEGLPDPWKMARVKADDYLKGVKRQARTSEEKAAREEAAPEELAALEAALAFGYPFAVSETLPSKITATELKGRFFDNEAAEEAEPLERSAPFRRGGYDRPDFVTQIGALTPTERGTALHLAMQHVRYERCGSVEEVRQEIERLVREKLLSPRQAETVNPRRIAAFFTSPLGRRVLKAERVWREFKFSLLLGPRDLKLRLTPEELAQWEASGDEILFQGVVDCCFEENGELYIVDFKTDRVPQGQLLDRAREYAGQISAYAHAMERVIGKKVARGFVYFFSLNQAAAVYPEAPPGR